LLSCPSATGGHAPSQAAVSNTPRLLNDMYFKQDLFSLG
jgi:hypothetical protein